MKFRNEHEDDPYEKFSCLANYSLRKDYNSFSIYIESVKNIIGYPENSEDVQLMMDAYFDNQECYLRIRLNSIRDLKV